MSNSCLPYMSKEEIEAEVTQKSFKTGQLHKFLRDSQPFWKEGPLPAIVQCMMDHQGNVIKEYITGKNGWEIVKKDSILLFVGPSEIEVVAEHKEQNIVENKRTVLKWLFNNKIIYWPYPELNGEPDVDLEDFFVVIEREKSSNSHHQGKIGSK